MFKNWYNIFFWFQSNIYWFFLDIDNSKTFITKAEFSINEIDRFVLTKNKNNEEGFHLSIILKGNINRDLFYIKDQQIELQGLEYILNEKLVNNMNNSNNYMYTNNYYNDDYNNTENQIISECPPPVANELY